MSGLFSTPDIPKIETNPVPSTGDAEAALTAEKMKRNQRKGFLSTIGAGESIAPATTKKSLLGE